MKRSALVVLALVAGCATAPSQDWTLGYRDGGMVTIWATPQGYEAKSGAGCAADRGSGVRVLARDVELAEVEVIDGAGHGCRGYVVLRELVDQRDHPGLTGVDSWMPQQVLDRDDGAVRPIFVSQQAAAEVGARRLIKNPVWRVRPEERANPKVASRLACVVPGGTPIELVRSYEYGLDVMVVAGPEQGCRGYVARSQIWY